MSQFYGTVRGSAKTEATRAGSKSSGISVCAASWKGAIRATVYEDENGVERYEIARIPWQGAGGDKACLIQRGEM